MWHVLPQYGGELLNMDLGGVEGAALLPFVPTLVKAGPSIGFPPGCEAQSKPRSGPALNYGITVVNSPGTVDPGYRGELGVILMLCAAGGSFTVEIGDRIAQLVVSNYVRVEFLEADLEASLRGDAGFGSTGL
jgi:dUTP pyrophosphatase